MLSKEQIREIEEDIFSIESKLKFPFMVGKNRIEDPLFNYYFVSILPYLTDLLAKAKLVGSRVSFTDDVEVDTKIKDVTSLIFFFKNALCSHPHSASHFADDEKTMKTSLAVCYCPVRMNLIEINDLTTNTVKTAPMKNDYEDDVSILVGKKTIYLDRHIRRAFNEAKEVFQHLGIIQQERL